jgi:hypothetical protein
MNTKQHDADADGEELARINQHQATSALFTDPRGRPVVSGGP